MSCLSGSLKRRTLHASSAGPRQIAGCSRSRYRRLCTVSPAETERDWRGTALAPRSGQCWNLAKPGNAYSSLQSPLCPSSSLLQHLLGNDVNTQDTARPKRPRLQATRDIQNGFSKPRAQCQVHRILRRCRVPIREGRTVNNTAIFNDSLVTVRVLGLEESGNPLANASLIMII